jgi:hypothetical protein
MWACPYKRCVWSWSAKGSTCGPVPIRGACVLHTNTPTHTHTHTQAEASIAAPFTSSTPNIAPLVTLMREGRAALVTSVSCFKFMALYSVIQFVTVLRLYQVKKKMSDMQYLWIGLCIIFITHSHRVHPLITHSHHLYDTLALHTHTGQHKHERHAVPVDRPVHHLPSRRDHGSVTYV